MALVSLLFSRSFQGEATWSSLMRPTNYNLAPSTLDSKLQRLTLYYDLKIMFTVVTWPSKNIHATVPRMHSTVETQAPHHSGGDWHDTHHWRSIFSGMSHVPSIWDYIWIQVNIYKYKHYIVCVKTTYLLSIMMKNLRSSQILLNIL